MPCELRSKSDIDDALYQDESSDTESDSPDCGAWRCGAVAIAGIALVGLVYAIGLNSPRSRGGFLDFPSEDRDAEQFAAVEKYEAAATVISQDWQPESQRVSAEDIPPGHLMTLYHQTSPEACAGIMRTDFRLGKGGWCGKGIYFALSPNATRRKAVAGSSGHGCMLEVTVDVGRIRRYENCGRFGSMNLKKLNRAGADSILFEPPEKSGDEVIIFESWRVVKKSIVPFDPKWMAQKWYGKPNR